MAERSTIHEEPSYQPHELNLNMDLAEDAQLYNESDGIRSVGHLLLSLRQVTAEYHQGDKLSDTEYDKLFRAHHDLIEKIRDLYG